LEATKLVDARRETDRLVLEFEGLRGSFRTATEPGTVHRWSTSLTLEPGYADYVLSRPDGAKTSSISLQLYSDPRNTTLVSSSVPLEHEGDHVSLSRWTAGTLARESNVDLARAREEIRALFQSESEVSDLERVGMLADHVYREIGDAWGTPNAAVAKAPGLAALRLAREGRGELDCGPSSSVFAAYASLAGLPARLVAIMGDFGSLALARHTVAEVWLADREQWVMVDLVSGIRFFTSTNNHPLSALEAHAQWVLTREAGLRPSLVTGAQIEDPYFSMKTHFSEDAVFMYPQPAHHSATKLEKLWTALTSPKLAHTRSPSKLLDRTLAWTAAYALSGLGVMLVGAALLGALVQSTVSRRA
jgi:hypothetical protein